VAGQSDPTLVPNHCAAANGRTYVVLQMGHPEARARRPRSFAMNRYMVHIADFGYHAVDNRIASVFEEVIFNTVYRM